LLSEDNPEFTFELTAMGKPAYVFGSRFLASSTIGSRAS